MARGRTLRIACEGATLVPLEDIQPLQRHLKSLSPENAAKLRHRLETVGFRFPFHLWKSRGKVYAIDGHQRKRVLEAMAEDGWRIPRLPAVWVKARSRRDAIEAVFEAASQYGVVEEAGLIDLVEAEGLTLSAIADEFRLPDVPPDTLRKAAASAPDADEAPALQATAVIKPGEVVPFGDRHRVKCGDACCREDVLDLLAGRQADLCFTDPPYNMAYRTKKLGGILNDDVASAAFLQLVLGSLAEVRDALRPGGSYYVCMSALEYAVVVYQLRTLGLTSAPLFWVKPSAGLGQQDYRRQVEVVVYGYTGERAERTWHGARKETDVWEFAAERQLAAREASDGGMVLQFGDGPLSVAVRLNGRLEGRVTWEDGRSSDVWRLPREPGAYVHPTQKPVALVSRAILNSSNPGDLVLDTFAGSGTTLVAADMTGRRAYVMDLDPCYCDVIIRRHYDRVGWAAAPAKARRRWGPGKGQAKHGRVAAG